MYSRFSAVVRLSEPPLGTRFRALVGQPCAPTCRGCRRRHGEGHRCDPNGCDSLTGGGGGWVTTHEEVTQRRLAELAVDAARAEAERAKADLQVAHRRLREAFEAVPEELRGAQEFLNAVVENVPVSIIVKNADDLRYVLVNRSGEQLLGVPREEILGRTAYDLLAKPAADSVTANDRDALAHDGQTLWKELNWILRRTVLGWSTASVSCFGPMAFPSTSWRSLKT